MTSLEPGFTPLIPRCTESIVAHLPTAKLRLFYDFLHRWIINIPLFTTPIPTHPLTTNLSPLFLNLSLDSDAFHFNSVTISSSVDTAVTEEHIVKSPET